MPSDHDNPAEVDKSSSEKRPSPRRGAIPTPPDLIENAPRFEPGGKNRPESEGDAEGEP